MVLSMKKGWRFLVYAESFSKKEANKKSILVGAIINGLSFLEEFRVALIKLYGLDSTEKVIEIYRSLNREDVNFIILSGVIIALYNIIDLTQVYETIKKPIIALSYRESKGLEDILSELPESDKRLEIYRKNGERTAIKLNNGHIVYIRTLGLNTRDARNILNKITLYGKIPEPVKITKALARSLLISKKNLC